MGLSAGFTAVILLFLFSYVAPIEAGKVLVLPIDGSHWLSMRPVLESLQRKGHEGVVLAPESSLLIKASEGSKVILYPVSYSREQVQNQSSSFSKETFTKGTVLEKLMKMRENMKEATVFWVDSCSRLLNNSDLIRTLEESAFDVIFTDPILPCGQILAEHLSVPTVNFLHSMPCHLDSLSSKCPVPLSYVPQMMSGMSDHMTFTQRVQNLLFGIVSSSFCSSLYGDYQKIASEFLQREVDIQEILGHSAIWLLKQDFAFDYPRPVMPNMVFIGGINCAQRKPLTQEFEKLVNSSGEHGFVVFSLGSMVSEIPMHKAMDIAEAFGGIPQTVIWRYTGKAPSNLYENTHLVKWLPQNDLLAHPKARAFITHAGSHGVYEGICNAVPMVMLPLFGDQMDNAKRVESRGAGITLNVLDFVPQDLTDALTTVINNPSYKENIQRLSALHLDRPIHPLDLAVHWVEFVMRHKGAPHLRPAAHDLNWIQYHSIDVFAFLLAVVLTTLFIGWKCCACAFRCCCGRKATRPKTKSKSLKKE